MSKGKRRHDWSVLGGAMCSRCKMLRAFADSGTRGGRHAFYGLPETNGKVAWEQSDTVPPCEGKPTGDERPRGCPEVCGAAECRAAGRCEG